jgi:regulator of protease activity HflC (stomatin/prohibitin superfamily)
MAVVLLVVVIVAAFIVAASVTKLAPHERAVVYRFGRVIPHPFGPGLVLKVPGVDRMVKVPIVEQKVDVPRATVTTMSGSSSPTDFTVAYKIVDAVRAVTEVADYRDAVATAARRMIENGRHEGSAADIGRLIRSDLDDTVRPWGIQIQSITTKRK